MKIIIPFTIFLLIITFFYCKKYPFIIEKFNSPNPSPSPAVTIKSNNKHLKMDFIYENPEYKDTKIENGQIVKYDWKKNLENKLCNTDDINESITPSPSPTISNNECSCINIGEQKICGKEFYRYIYECPNKCSKCKDCLTTNPHTSDIECQNVEGRDKCDLLREKMIFSKEYYTPNDRKSIDISIEHTPNPSPSPIEEKRRKSYKKSIVRSKDLFQTTLYNDFLTNNNILIRINPISEFLDEINKIVVQNVYFNNNKKEYNIFYEDNKEVDIIIIPNNSDSGLNISLKITGYYKLNKNHNFTLERIINIYEYKKPEEIQKSEEEKHSKPLMVTSAYGEDYQNNYLGESEIKTEHLYKNPTFVNKIKDKPLGEFKKKEILDSPETWEERADINRPWISTFSEVFTDMFAEYNFDKKEKSYEMSFIKKNLKSIEKGTDKLSQEELQSMFGPSASFDFYDEFSKKDTDMRSLLKMKLEKDKIRFQKQKEKEKEKIDYFYNIIKNRREERYYYLINIHKISISPSPSPSPSPSKNNISSILKHIKKNNNNIVVIGKDNQYTDKTNILNILKKQKIQNRTNINDKSRILIIDNDYIKLLYSENQIDEKNNFKNIIKKALINKMEIVTYVHFLTDLGKNILITGEDTFYKKILKFLLEKQGRIVKNQENKNTIFTIDNSKTTLFNTTNLDNITNRKNIVIRDNSIKSKPIIINKIINYRVDRVTRFIDRSILTKTFSDNNTILIISEKEINEKDIKDEELHIPIMTHSQFKKTLNLAF